MTRQPEQDHLQEQSKSHRDVDKEEVTRANDEVDVVHSDSEASSASEGFDDDFFKPIVPGLKSFIDNLAADFDNGEEDRKRKLLVEASSKMPINTACMPDILSQILDAS